MIKVGVLNGKKQIDDFNMSLDSIINEGVVSGLEVSASSVSSGKAFVSVTRTGSESFLLGVHLTADETVTLGNNKKIYLSIDQSKIDDGLLVNLDGSNIASIVVGDSWPSGSHLKLAETDGSGVIFDKRKFIKFKPNPFNLIKLEKNGIYPQWCKIGRLRIPDCSRFKIDLIGGVGYGTYGYANGGSLVRIIGGAATGVFTIGGNWTENNNISGISEVRFIEVTDSEFDLYLYFENGSNPYGELLMKFDGGENSEFIKDFSVATPTGGVIFPKITPGTEIIGLAEKTGLIGSDIFIISDSENGGINKKITISNALKSNKFNFVAGENISAGNPLHLHTDGKVYKAGSHVATINFIGFAVNTVSVNNNVTVDLSGINSNQSGLTIGATYYLTNTNGIISTTPGTYVYSVGKAVSATSISINNISDRVGNYQSKSFNTNYQAETSGYVIATSTGAQYSNTTTDTIIGYVGSSNPAGTIVARSTLKSGNAMSEGCSIMFPVSKGQWYRCTASTSSGYSYFSMSFVPNT